MTTTPSRPPREAPGPEESQEPQETPSPRASTESDSPSIPATPATPATTLAVGTWPHRSARSSESPPARLVKQSRDDVATRAARVKRAWRIEEVIARYGVHLTSSGDHRLAGLCPFHVEEHASFTVYPETQSFCCYGCHAAGDVITFVCLIEHVRFNEALRLLGESELAPTEHDGDEHARVLARRSVPGPAARVPPVLAFSTRSGGDEAPVGREAHEQEDRDDALSAAPEGDEAAASLQLTLLSVATALAMQGLAHAPSALAYLGVRGISLALARSCRIGYLHDAALLDYLAGDERLERAAREVGLLNRLCRGTLARRLIVPEIRHGRTVQLIGRTLPGAQTPLPHIKYYLVCGTGEKGLLGYGRARDHLARARFGPAGAGDAGQREVVRSIIQHAQWSSRRGLPIAPAAPRAILVLEGALDYVIAVGWELPVLPVALLSAYPSRAQLAELLDLRARSGDLPMLLMHDTDDAGREATAHVARSLAEQHVPFHVLPPLPRLRAESPHYKDLAELGPLGRAGRAQVLAGIGRALDHPEQGSSAE